MTALIIEDEIMAANSLARIIKQYYPDIEITGHTKSVRDTVNWLLSPGNKADILFMDVELSDGPCFEIFRQVDIDSKVIMTTAYENYAVHAFEVNSVDYLLKPIELSALNRAIERCRKSATIQNLSEKILKSAESMQVSEHKEYRQRFLIRINDRIVPVNTNDIAWFYSEDKNTYMVTFSKNNYIMDNSLDIIYEELDPKKFFRISRGCIISMDAVDSITKYPGGRLTLTTRPESSSEISVSRSRSDNFLKWMEE